MVDVGNYAVAVIVAVVASAAIAGLFALFAGINRIPWRYGLLIGVGNVIVLGAAVLASSDERILAMDPGTWVLVGAIGGGLAVAGYERGRAHRRAVTTTILGAPPHAPI